jgi:CSLREA domain-containing protein
MKIVPSNRYISLPVVLVFCCLCAVLFTNSASSEGPRHVGAGTAKEATRMFDIGFGGRTFKYQPGRDTQSRYLGSAALLQAMQSAQAQPRTMISDDFNGDGMGDLVIGYANGSAGVLSFRQGNVQAIAPTGEVFQGITQGRYPAPFLQDARLYELPVAPDFLQVGDFNSDGYVDVLAAARGGVSLYLLAGDGSGTLGAPQEFDLPGQLTALQSDDLKQPGKFTSVALGVRTLEGPKALIYRDAGLSGTPESISMPADINALAFGRLDDDDISDVAAATSNQVTVIHGVGEQAGPASAAKVETESLPFEARGIAIGDFVFDRNHQREIAVLGADGTVYLSARGNPDRRPFSDAEKKTISDLHRAVNLHKIEMDEMIAESNKLVRPNAGSGWNVAETINTGITPSYNTGAPALFQRLNASDFATDDLYIADGASNRLQIVKNETDAAKLNIKSTNKSTEPLGTAVDGEPLAAVSMRLGVNALPGTVVLRAGQSEPEVSILAPNAVFTVNSTADLPDSVPTAANGVCQASNGLCTLRAAIMQSNHTGGSNTIMVPDNTYTLTLGPPDDEANTGGATEQSGDLDIFSWADFDGSPILTAVSITGGTRDGCIIQMGTLSPTLASAVPNNKERILQVNDSATGAGQDRVNVTLTNLTMQNAVEPTGSGTFLDGGAVRFDGFDFTSNTNIGLLTLHNTKLQNNTSAGFGGGVFVGFGSLVIETTSIVRANTAQHKVGGGVGWTGGNTVETQFFRLDGSTVGGALAADGNLATDTTFGAGAGLDVRGGASVTVQNTSVIQNNVGSVQSGTIGGGGIQINSPSVVFSNSSINNNTCRSNGGGIFNSARNAVTNAASTLTMTTVNVNGNTADSDNSGAGDGGGLYNFFGTAVIQTNSHVDGNTAVNGGGIFQGWTGIAGDSTAGLTVQTTSTIGQAGAGNGNTAKNNGGSIAIQQVGATTFGPITLTGLTFTNNTANSDNAGGGDGGAIFISAGTITSLSGCTIDSNVANSGTGDGIRQTGGSINGAGTLNINGGDSISISGGTFTSTSGTMNITGNLLNSGGTFAHNNGTVVCNGSSAQTIGGTTAMTFNNLTISNAAGVTMGASETVAGTLTLTSGVLSIGTNTLTLNGPVSFTSGTISSSATGTVNYNQSAANQNVAPGSYGNLTFSNFAKVLPNGATVQIAGTFTPGTGTHTITGSTIDFNGSGAQTIPAINYNNLTSSNTGARTLANSGTIGIAGVFTPGTNAYTITGSTINFNGAGAQTIPAFNYNNLTSSNTGARTLANAGTVGVAGVFTPGTNTYTITGSTIDFNGAGAQTIPAFNYNNLTSSNTGARTLANAGTIGIAGVFTPGTNVYTITGSTIDFNGAGAQTIPAFNYNNLTSSNTGARTLANAGTIGIAGVFTPGTNTYTITGSTIDFNGAGAQTIPAFNYNNLTSSNTGARTLANAGTIGIAGAFTPGTNTYTITGSTIDFNGAGAQTIPAFNYNNLTSSNTGARTLANAGTIGVAAVFTPGSNTYTITGSTVSFNGAGAQTVPQFNFNSLTIANTHGANVVTLVNGGTIGIAGTFTPGTSTFAITGNTINFNGAGAQTIPAFNYNNLTSSNTGARTLANAGTIGIAGVFTPGTNAYTVTNSTINFNGAGSQNIPGFTYFNLTSSGGGVARILDPVNTIKIAGAFTPGADLYTITGSTIEYNGSAAQSLPVTFITYNNLTFNNPTTVTGGPATMDVNGNLQITQGTFAAGGALSITVGGNWTNNGGTFTPSTGDVTFDGGAGQAIGGTTATTFNNLSNGNASGLAMNNDNTVNGNLALVGSDITVAATKTLTQPLAGTSSGTFDVNGRVQRNGFVTGGAALSFGNPFNTIQVTAGVAPANIVVDLARSVPGGAMGYPTAVARTYTITPSAAGFTGTLRLHYLDSELNGNTEGAGLNLWRFNGTGWSPNPITGFDTTANWVEKTGVSTFSPWTMNSINAPTASNGVITGRIVDDNGNAVEGAVVRLQGSQNRKFITDANGVYRFENVETSGFYTVTPSRANYTFSPAERSFSQLGLTTEAAFGASVTTSQVVNPLDTPEYFVRQHYIDFLGREPDEAGFNYWSDQIIGCGADLACVDRKRENVSAAYFLSIEFQQTGGLVDGLYRASYGVRPLYNQFLPDQRAVAAGVVVGLSGWQAKLQANKDAFVAAFVNRPGFRALYDGLNNAQFVDTLISNTGVQFTAGERDDLVSGLTQGTLSRAQALNAIAENERFKSAKFNDAFVMMEYFGYLRRDADAPGFQYWLDKLTRAGGNYEQSEMVKAFIVSGEYRDRFPK